MAIINDIGSIQHDTRCFVYHKQSILLINDETTSSLPVYGDITFLLNASVSFMMDTDSGPVWIVDMLDDQHTERFMLKNIKEIYGHFDEEQRQYIAKSFEYIHWARTHQFCGICGEKTVFDSAELSIFCAPCNYHYYPKLSPSIIVLITRGNEMLLARSPHFPPGMYSALAGYVEPGETLEQTVVREVKEEVNIEIKNVRYASSQSWPFPDTLMIGFYAEYAGGELQVDGKEIEAAGWYTPDNLPTIPRKISIAWQLIDGFVRGVG